MLSPVFNVTGGEVVIIILAALVILGPEKLPDVVRRAGRLYGELRRMSDGFQSELRSALDEPTRELRETADLAKSSFTGVVDTVKTAVNPGAALTDKVMDAMKGTNGTAKPATDDPKPAELVPAELVAADGAGTPAAAAAPAPAGWSAPPAEAIGTAAPLPPPAAPLAPPAAFPAPTLPAPGLPAPSAAPPDAREGA